ncbi:MAG: transcription termination factor NusA [Vigna little leaf phytoplasma]|nr:transcription termination factor NusA [Vigna little leaf phytoplasma]
MKIRSFLSNIDKLAEENELTREQVLDAFKKGLISGCRKHCRVKSCRVDFNNNFEEFILYKQYLVIDDNKDNHDKNHNQKNENINNKKINLINLEEAQKIKNNAKIGELIEIEINPQDFNFYASKEFKNKFNEELIKKQRENTFNLLKNYENKLINAKVIDINENSFTLELEKNISANLAKTRTLINDNFNIGERVQVYVVAVQNTTKMPRILISRTHVNFVIEIFKEFIPEIKDGLIEIISIARFPSEKVKIGLLSNDKKIDPIGSCIGKKGNRIKSIINILKDEKIDLFLWSNDPRKLITNALKPAQITKIIDIDEKNKTAVVLVNEKQIALVIGKSGRNIQLAIQVTKWNIQIETTNSL